jgi:glycosyltransferase involved in cell wall biosynthesis
MIPEALADRASVIERRDERAKPANSVLLVGNFLHASTGTFGVCEGLAMQLADAGWQVITTSDRPQPLLRLADMLTTIWRRRRDYSVAQVDVYSGSAFLWAEASCWLLSRLHRPYVLTLHGGALPTFAERHPDRVTRLLRSAAAVTTPSAYLSAGMSAFRPDLILQPNPIAVARYPFQVRSHPRPRLVWVRAFHEIYNPIMALRAVALLRADFPEIRLIMVGPDKGDGTRERTVAAVRELDLEDVVEFRGPIEKSKLPDVFAEGDIFLNTSNVDNTPVTVVEALASGLCVVSTSVGGIPFLLHHGHDALLVPPNDHHAMSEAIRQLVMEPATGEKLSIAGRANALERDWDLLLPRWESLLREVAAHRRH